MKSWRPIGLLPALVAFGVATAVGTRPCPADDWPQWRGPHRNGRSAERLPTPPWPAAGPTTRWHADVGVGYAAVSVAGGRVFTIGNDAGRDIVRCLDADTGRVVWRHVYPCRGGGGGFPGPRVAPTVAGDAVYVLSVDGRLARLDAATGRPVWVKDLRRDLGATLPRHGVACHPLVLGEQLILEAGAEGGSIVSLATADGGLRWKAGQESVGYSSPVPCRPGDAGLVVFLTGTALVGLDAADGRHAWRYPWRVRYEISAATPIVEGNRVFISSGYGQGCALVEIGDGPPRTVWRNREMSNHFATCVLWQGHLYGFDGAPLTLRDTHRTHLKCLALATGRPTWAQDGLGKGSLLAAGDRLVILSERGELVVAEASPEQYKEVARARILDNTCWTMPVLADGRIYCRNYPGRLVCVDVRGPDENPKEP